MRTKQGLNYKIVIFFLPPSSFSHPWKREEGEGCCAGEERAEPAAAGAATRGARVGGGRGACADRTDWADRRRGGGRAEGGCCHRRRWGEGEEGPARTGKQRNPRYNNGGFSPGKKTFARAEVEIIDWHRFEGPIDKSDALQWSPRRGERNSTLGFRGRCTDLE
jgi:hypothetical protein